MQSPKIQLYNALFSQLQAKGYDVYQYLPSEDVPYPFIHLDSQNDIDLINNKDVIFGDLSQTIHVWGYANDKATFEDGVWQTKQLCRRLNDLTNYYVRLVSLNESTIEDRTTNDVLYHSTIQVGYRIN